MEFTPVKVIGTDEEWGNLVLSWAANRVELPGKAYTDDQAWLYVFPAGTAIKQIGEGSAGAVFPNSVQEVVFVRDTSTRRYVRLPDPEMVKAAQDEMAQGSEYQLPRFYAKPPLNCGTASTPGQRRKLQKERVGDYSIGSCM